MRVDSSDAGYEVSSPDTVAGVSSHRKEVVLEAVRDGLELEIHKWEPLS